MTLTVGGLNYQIEHHLFPRLPMPHQPMPHLRKTRLIVRQYCAESNVPYHETGPLRSWAEALGRQRGGGAPLPSGWVEPAG